MKRLVPAAILLAGLAGTFAVSAETDDGTSQSQGNRTELRPQPIGLSGCASSNCHGRSGRDTSPESAWRTSCTVWAARDPHARAYDVLDPEKNAIAKKMQKAFPRLKEDPRCRACHSNPGIPAGREYEALRSEGVSCESCHGNAEFWVRTHTQMSMTDRHGLAELNDLGSRASACAGCHVGSPGRDMNHDMIAAGHPKLNFEFASHLARLPRHWYERDRMTGEKRGPEFLLQAWAVGPFRAGESVRALSIDRQSREQGRIWPELAEWNCYACHHELLGKPWRSAAGFRLGEKAWTLSWPLGNVEAADALVPGLGRRIENGTKAVSTATGAQRLNAVGQLATLLRDSRPTNTGNNADRVFKSIEATKTISDWDSGYRIYLTLGVLETVRMAGKQPESAAIVAGFKELEKALNLPGHPKESTFDPNTVHSLIVKLTGELRKAWPESQK